MPLGCAFTYAGLIDFYADTGALGYRNHAVLVGKDFWICQIVKQVIGCVAMNAQALFLDEGVLKYRIELQIRRQGDGVQRAAPWPSFRLASTRSIL